MRAPVVLAKGQDLVALKIREIAEANNIPVFEDVALARSMYKQVSVDSVIPSQFYQAVAELVRIVYANKAASARRDTHEPASACNIPRRSSSPTRSRRWSANCAWSMSPTMSPSSGWSISPTVSDLVDSAAELFFMPGTLKLGHGGEAHLGWTGDAADRARPGAQAARRDRLFRADA